jgi:nucleoside-diphosphate-sugar epimerase
MQKVTIFGCGWLGEPLADYLSQKGFEVIGTVRSEESLQKLKVKPFSVVCGDIAQVDALPSSIFETDIFVIAIPYKMAEHFRALIERIQKAKIDKVIYVSSTSVYENNNGVVNEIEGPMNLKSSIFQIEEEFRKSGLRTTFIRFAGLIGPKRHPGRFFQRSGRAVSQPDAPVNFIHLTDCIGIIHEVIKQNAWGKVYNGCGPHHPIKREFYDWAAKDAGYSVPEMNEESQLSFKKVDGSLVEQELAYHYKVVDLYQSKIYRTLE